ncbi:hypothetical protein [Lamprobacter modestohalophilus]|nr:hypothetical protein [Lamprobacter modestohalophilus]
MGSTNIGRPPPPTTLGEDVTDIIGFIHFTGYLWEAAEMLEDPP